MRQSPSVCGRATSLQTDRRTFRASTTFVTTAPCMRRPTWSVHEPVASSCSVTRRTLRRLSISTRGTSPTCVRSAGTCSPSAMSTTRSRCLAPSQRRGRLGRARRHTADAVRHWATNLVSAAPSTKPCSRFLGAKSAATSHRARSSMRPAKAWVKEHKGQYYDALHVKNGIVKICLVESQGGIAPPTKRIIFNFAKEVGSPSAVDRTDYGTASGSARGFAQHHSQQALARRRLWRRAEHQQRCSQHACRALIHDRSQCPTPLRAGLLGPRVVSPHPQGLQGSHLNLSQTSAQRHSPSDVFSSQ